MKEEAIRLIDLNKLPIEKQFINPIEGSLAVDGNSGDILMYTGESWCTCSKYRLRKLTEILKKL